MIRYETAVLLKQNGFLQRQGGQKPSEHLRWGEPVYLCSHKNKCDDMYSCPTSVYLPSLDHLVDTLGGLLGGFKRLADGKIEASMHREGGSNGVNAIANSYREAAALLWIALKGE